MDAAFSQLLDWIAANPAWAYVIVGLVALAESLAVVGMVVPGVVVMIGAGALIASGEISFWPTCLSAVAGAIVGDGLSYWIGHRYRDSLRLHWPFSRYPEHLDRGIVFFDRYGAKSVVFGRFFGPGRAIVPLVAGMLHMRPRRFVVANVGSALAWSPAYLAPGIAFGASMKLAAEAAARLAVLLILLLLLIWLSVWLSRKIFWLVSPRASTWLRQILEWADIHPKMGRVAQALADPSHPDAATLTALAAALLGATAVLGLTIGIGLFGPADLTINQIAVDLGQSLHTPLADDVMLALGRLGSPAVLAPLLAAVAVYLASARRRRDVNYWISAAGFAAVAVPTLGWLLEVPRPDLGLALRWPWSFPSVQVLSATLMYGFLAIMISRGIQGPGRWLPFGAAAVIIASVTAARLYFGTEWLTDLIGSIALGLAWISALGLAYRRHSLRILKWSGLTLVALASAGAGFAGSAMTRHQSELARYTPRHPVQHVAAEEWRERGCGLMPRRREDLWRAGPHLFEIAYAGSLEALQQGLAPLGWEPATMLSWGNAMRFLSPSVQLAELPVVPHVHDGRHEKLTLVKDTSSERRLVLRLWSTPCLIESGIPVWVGDMTTVELEDIAGLLTLPVTIRFDPDSMHRLLADLQASPELSIAHGAPLRVAPTASGLLSEGNEPPFRTEAQPAAPAAEPDSASSSRW